MQDTKFMRFMLNFWINPSNYKRASRACAVFLNLLIGVLKFLLCGVILVIVAPHMGANVLLNRHRTGILYVLLVIISLVIDIPLAAVSMIGAMCTITLLSDAQIVSALVCGLITWGLVRATVALVSSLFSRQREEYEDEEECDDEDAEEEDVYEYEGHEDIDDLRFCQLFTLGEDMCLLIDHIEMCPDETAFIRVVDYDGYTPLYKRKVNRDRAGSRFIRFNGTNLYLDDSKTQPIITHNERPLDR